MRLIDADKIVVYIGGRINGKTMFADMVKKILDQQPTVEAEPVRHAHWIWKGDEGDSRFMCSECKCKENAPTCMGVPDIWEYCPNCGAKMEEYELARKRIERKEE